jgi:hypothetical protein
MRQTPKSIVLGAVMMAVGLSIAAPAAAGKLDLTLSEFANCNSAGRCRPQRADYESFLAEYAFGLVPKKLAPAETLGYSGFYMGMEGTISVRPTGSAAEDRWQTGTRTNEIKAIMFNPGIHIRKGLPFSFELGSTVSYLVLSELVTLGGEIKWAPFEGFRSGWRAFLPDVAIRGSLVRIIGEDDVDMSIIGLDGSISYAFGIGGMLTLTPYAGYQFYWTIINLEPLTYRTGNDYHTETESGGTTYWDTNSLGNPLLKRHSLFFGLRLGYELLAYTMELGWALPREWDTQQGNATAKVGNQIQISFGLGVDF